jgi:cytochrome P450
MGVNLCAQLGEDRQSEIVKIFKELGSTYNSHRGIWAVPLVRLRRRKLARKLNVLLRDFISETFEEMKRASQPTATARLGSCSILTLILQDANELTPAIMDRTCDQLKTFLFAGHDTTSILLQWALYEVSRTPRAMNAVRRELDYIFGSDTSPRSVGNILLSEDGKDLLSKMRYTSAVIKETLRLYPPSGSARYAERGSGLTLTLPNGRVSCVDGLVLYNCATIIQRDETVYGESKDEFAPERWLQDDELNMHLSQNKGQDRYREARFAGPPSAWRPFERGPRNCIGQELAMIEARLILASVVRRYDFAKVGLGEIAMDENGLPVLNSHGQYETKSKIYNVITSPPVPRPAIRILLADF